MNQPMTSPEVVVCENREQAAQYVAEHFSSAIESNPNIVLGLATGGTPVDVYRVLVQRHREAGLDFSQATSFNLDEYVGLDSDHPESYRYFMQQQLFDHVNFVASNTHVPDGCAVDLELHAEQYEASIRDSGGIDLQLLGIGTNGHIAFNEPGSRSAITMGVGTILEAKRIVLMATGEGKAKAVAEAIDGEIDPGNPASALQRHDNVVFVLDRMAASRLDS